MARTEDGRVRIAAGEASAEFALTGGELMTWRVGGAERVWHGDPAHWSRRAPILFPLVGASAAGAIRVAGQSYAMPQHGFARDGGFTLVEAREDRLRLRLVSDAASRVHYPFAFTLDVVASIKPTTLSIVFEVTHTGAGTMPYALGFHPAFPWPLEGGTRDGHAVVFEERESPDLPEVVAGGLLSRQTRTIAFDGRHLTLDSALFTEALVFLDARNRAFRFVAPSGAALSMTMQDFPHLAVWSRPTAPFVSLECWTGHADWEDFAGELSDRASMRRLAAGEMARHAVTLGWHAAA